MIAVIFEVWPAEGRRDDYLRLAAELKAHLMTFDGFISLERFESLYEEGKLLSLQFWRDEAAVTAWRTDLTHRRVQALGRNGLFPRLPAASRGGIARLRHARPRASAGRPPRRAGLISVECNRDRHMPNIYYTSDHEWLKVDGDTATVGITAYAAEQLGDVVYVELPETGRTVKKGESAAVVESVKAASDVYSPVSGEVIETNGALQDEPGTVNQAAETGGWFLKLRLSDPSELDALLDEEAYRDYIDTL